MLIDADTRHSIVSDGMPFFFKGRGEKTMSETGFEVGSTYENEKGAYEVLSIDEQRDTMVIKWESGEEVATAIGFQKRILQRMLHDAEVAKFGTGL